MANVELKTHTSTTPGTITMPEIQNGPMVLRRKRAQDSRSPLITLPPELQGNVVDYLPVREDLNNLSQTCKILNAIAIPKLYKEVVLTVPIRWLRLASFEHLLSSSGEGLRYTIHVTVKVQNDPIKAEQKGTLDALADEEIEDEERFIPPEPLISTSSALNSLVRLFIAKIRPNQLRSLCWVHYCAIDTSTISLLQKTHGKSLKLLRLNNGLTQSDECEFVGSQGLEALGIRSLNPDKKIGWPCRLILQNRDTLCHLGLGVEAYIAKDYTIGRRLRQKEASDWISKVIKELSEMSDTTSVVDMPLRSLMLCGLDFDGIISGKFGITINFVNLTVLRLESCSHLHEALDMFINHRGDTESSLRIKRLSSFMLRHEGATEVFCGQLTKFLVSFKGLQSLEVLLEGSHEPLKTSKILKAHGRTLRTLLWDERSTRRTWSGMSTSVSNFLPRLNNISKYCPHLVSLGLCVNWTIIKPSSWDKSIVRPYSRIIEHADVVQLANHFKKMPRLETLSIRNLPEASSCQSWLPTDYMFQGLAAMFMDIVTSDIDPSPGDQNRIKIIALGAPTYNDRKIGANHFPFNDERDFLRLRVYQVDYRPNCYGRGVSPILKMVSKGSPAHAYRTCSNIGILENYWLG